MKKMSVDEAIEYLEADDSFDDFSFRGDDYIPADRFNNSQYHGDDGTEYELDGVSTIGIPALSREYIESSIKSARKYGVNVFLLRGRAINADEANHDPGEVLMAEHQIVAIIRG